MTDNKKLIKATELPRHGNPYPPKDIVIQDEQPTKLESSITSARESVAPWITPFTSRMKNIIDTGYAHSSTAIQGLSDTQRNVFNGAVVASAAMLSYKISRRQKPLVGAFVALGTALVVYPEVRYIMQNKILVDSITPFFMQLRGSREQNQNAKPQSAETNK